MLIEFQCKSRTCWFNATYEDGLEPLKCPKCGGRNCRIGFVKERKRNIPVVNIDGSSKGNPRWSWSMGVNIQDIPTMMKQYPDRTYNPETGQLLVEHRQHKKRLMREHDMEELS